MPSVIDHTIILPSCRPLQQKLHEMRAPSVHLRIFLNGYHTLVRSSTVQYALRTLSFVALPLTIKTLELRIWWWQCNGVSYSLRSQSRLYTEANLSLRTQWLRQLGVNHDWLSVSRLCRRHYSTPPGCIWILNVGMRASTYIVDVFWCNSVCD